MKFNTIIYFLGTHFLFFVFFVIIGNWMFTKGNTFLSFDNSVSLFIYQLRTPFLDEGMKLISFLGNEALLLFSFFLFGYFIWKNQKKEFFFSFFVLTGGMILNIIAKFLINRPRPTISPLVQEVFTSFPSGHAMNSMIFYGLIIFYLYQFNKNANANKILTGIIILLILSIGFSRVYLGVHYPTDIFGGYILGILWLQMNLKIRNLLYFFNTSSTFSKSRK